MAGTRACSLLVAALACLAALPAASQEQAGSSQGAEPPDEDTQVRRAAPAKEPPRGSGSKDGWHPATPLPPLSAASLSARWMPNWRHCQPPRFLPLACWAPVSGHALAGGQEHPPCVCACKTHGRSLRPVAAAELGLPEVPLANVTVLLPSNDAIDALLAAAVRN